MTERWTLRWTERIFAEYLIKKQSNFAVSKDKWLFDLLIQKNRWGRPRIRYTYFNCDIG